MTIVADALRSSVATKRSPFSTVPLRDAMRRSAGGVSVITAGVGNNRTGATVTTAISFSVEPETMLVSINLSSSTWPPIRHYGHFCVNVLSNEQQAVADRFAGRGGIKGPARYLGSSWSRLVTGAGVLDDSLASVDCEVEEVIERHSHALIFGAVRAVTLRDGEALGYADGRYATLNAL